VLEAVEYLLVVIDYSIGATSRLRTRESIRLQVTVPANADTHDCCPIREHRSTNRIASYKLRLR
jgi:hypothetical protein